MAKCDICAAAVPAHQLETLLPQYAVPGVRDICPQCSRWAVKHKGHLLDGVTADMRTAIAERAGKPRRRFWLW